ncbi:uncharacterized protein LOC126991102 [Eriocheir sinensis]|uniref:uncharacterized protein LOC126991102 n=1 Tax=Eriocheir sinensis TaxID=95602 RepID=UPI0021C62E8D|nr:uncharacterized protein LOC126991102 [Eriocheir sinensis]
MPMSDRTNPWPTPHTTEEDVLVDLPTTVLLIKFVEEGDSAMGTVMLLNFLNAWKVQEPSSRPGEPSDHTLQDSLLILGHTQPHPSGRRLAGSAMWNQLCHHHHHQRATHCHMKEGKAGHTQPVMSRECFPQQLRPWPSGLLPGPL